GGHWVRGQRGGVVDRLAVLSDRTSPITPAGFPATIAKAGTSRVTPAPAPTRAPAPIVSPPRIVAWLPIDASLHTRGRARRQSASVFGWPPGVVARGNRSLTNITTCPTNTPSSIVRPVQRNECDEILHRAPIETPRWISTNGPTVVRLPIEHP